MLNPRNIKRLSRRSSITATAPTCSAKKTRSNVKMEHPILRKLVDQKADYLLARKFTVESENTAYSDALNDLFDNTFRRKIKSFGKGAVKSGIAYLAPYYDDTGMLRWMRLPSTEVIPLWTDFEHTELDAYIRFYRQTVYEGKNRREIIRVEFWDKSGVTKFKSDSIGGTLYPDADLLYGRNTMKKNCPFAILLRI